MPGTNDIATDENAAEAVDPFDTRGKYFVFIERDYSENLAIQYDTEAEALRAMKHSLLVDSFCYEDCLDCWVGDDAERIKLGDFEIVLSNEDDSYSDEPEED